MDTVKFIFLFQKLLNQEVLLSQNNEGWYYSIFFINRLILILFNSKSEEKKFFSKNTLTRTAIESNKFGGKVRYHDSK